jgi:hypothetical protein
MKDALKVFVEAAKETPALYFAPVMGAIKAASKVSDDMTKSKGAVPKDLAPFTVDKTRHHRRAK